MNNDSLLTDDNKLLIPEALLIDIHHQLQLFAVSDKRGNGYDGISVYLKNYYSDKLKKNNDELFKRCSVKKIGLSGGSIERVIKGEKGKLKTEIKYELLDFLCVVCWAKTLVQCAFDKKYSDKPTLYSIELSQYAPLEITNYLNGTNRHSQPNNNFDVPEIEEKKSGNVPPRGNNMSEPDHSVSQPETATFPRNIDTPTEIRKPTLPNMLFEKKRPYETKTGYLSTGGLKTGNKRAESKTNFRNWHKYIAGFSGVIIVAICLFYFFNVPHTKKIQASELAKALILIVLQADTAEFKSYQALPEIKTDDLKKLMDTSGTAYKRIYNVLIKAAPKKSVLNNPYNPSGFTIYNIWVDSLSPSMVIIKTKEYWYLKWYDSIRHVYVDTYDPEEGIYNEDNEQKWTLIKESGTWKVFSAHYPGKHHAIMTGNPTQ